jgi:hypothetical protein
MDQVMPSVLTTERAAAAKIYLETYFNERLMQDRDPRSARLDKLKAKLLSRPGGIDDLPYHLEEVINMEFCRRESCHLRETRVMKMRSVRALAAPRGSNSSSVVNDYEFLKILGKGSFGVVRLVREKSRCFEGERRQLYAMKVIRKSTMLRSCQEGHLRAERDILVASEGSEWYSAPFILIVLGR